MPRIDLNADVGEGLMGERELLPLVTSANIACGAHAGSSGQTRASVGHCISLGIRVGAHPGYPDPSHMGRRTFGEIGLPRTAVLESLRQQLELIPEAAYIKPHGALYNESAADADSVAGKLMLELLSEQPLPLMGLPGSAHEQIAKDIGVLFIREGFLDRRYGNDGLLLPRSDPNAMVIDPAESCDQAVRLARVCDSLCVHGDTSSALDLVRAARSALEQAGFDIGW